MDEKISRKAKYQNIKKPRDERFEIPFDLDSLNLFCSYILSENTSIRKGHLINIRNLFLSINPEASFKNDIDKIERYEFILKGLDARIEHGFNRPVMILKYINGGLIEDDKIDPKNFHEISNLEFDWINETVTMCIKNSYMNNTIDDLLEACSEYNATPYKDRAKVVSNIEQIVTNVHNGFRQAVVRRSDDELFSLADGIFEDKMEEIYNNLTAPSNKLQCNMQGLNELLAGGFSKSSVYLFFGLSGEGKTTTMTNLLCQIKKQNINYKTKDPTKKPCIAFVTMENTMDQMIELLFNLTVSPKELKEFTLKELIHELRTTGGLKVTTDDPIDIIIRFKPNLSVDTNYLYSLMDELEDQNYECIVLFQDYIKRIRSTNHTGDMRLDLGAVVNEFKSFAAYYKIPVITASQFNRTAMTNIDAGRKLNKADLVRTLGRDQIGESLLVLENADGAFFILPESDADGNKFLGFQRVKNRYKSISSRIHFYQPYDKYRTIYLVEDGHLATPVFRESVKSNRELNNFQPTRVSTYHSNNIKNLDDDVKFLQPENNLFENSCNSYKFDSIQEPQENTEKEFKVSFTAIV